MILRENAKTFISAFVRARLCVCQNEGEGQFTCCCFIEFLLLLLFFFFSLLYVQYTYFAFITNLTSSAVTRIEVSSG